MITKQNTIKMIQKILISLGICIVLWAIVYFLVVRPLVKDIKTKPKKDGNKQIN